MNDPLLLNYNIITKVNGKTAIELRFVLIPQFLEIHPGEREREAVGRKIDDAGARTHLPLSFSGIFHGKSSRRRSAEKCDGEGKELTTAGGANHLVKEA